FSAATRPALSIRHGHPLRAAAPIGLAACSWGRRQWGRWSSVDPCDPVAPGSNHRRECGSDGAARYVPRMARRIPMTRFDSSSIAAGGYDARSRTLRLRYVSGGTYDYKDVPGTVFDELLDAPS